MSSSETYVEKNTWSRSETIILIELYKACTVLYTSSHSSYLNKSKKDECWIHILKEIRKQKPNTTLTEIKIKIKTLRQQYSRQRAAILQARRNGVENAYVPSLWCYKQLKFLEKSVDESLSASPRVYGSTQEDSVVIKKSRSLDGTQWTPDSSNHRTQSTVQTPLDAFTISELEEVETNEIKDNDIFKVHDLYDIATTALKHVQESAKRKIQTSSEKKRHAFGEYIAQELSKIENEEIAEETQFSMILVVRDALKKDREQRKS